MADSPLNNSWPSFSKFWMKRWSFKKEWKQCSQEFPRGQERSLPACVNIDNRSNSLSEVEEMYFNRMAEGKDDPFLDYDDSAIDATSSTEDIPSLDSSVQLSSMTLRDPKLSRCPVTSSSEDVTRVDTVSGCPGQLGKIGKNNVVTQLTDCCPSHETVENKNPSLLLKASGCGLTEGDGIDQNNSTSDLENLSDGEDQDSLPLLIRSMSCSRRHSWEGPLSPTALGDVRRRLSLDVLGIDSDGEGEREDEDQLDQSGYELTEPLNANPVSGESDRQAPRGQGQANSSMSEDEMTEQVKEGTKMRPRLETYLSKGAEGRSSAQCRESEPETSLEIHEEKENLEPNHLLVQQVLQELKAFHGHCNGSATSARTGSGSGALSGSNSPHDLTWMEFLAEKEGDGKCERPEKETKVKRTLSSLKNRVTGSFKDKAKTKEKEKESPKEKRKCNNGHCLVPGSFSSSTSCTLCSKPLSGKTSYQCMNCAVNVHKNCRMLLAECTTPKSKQKDSQQKYSGSPQNTAQPAPLVKEQPRCLPLATDGTSGAVRSIGMTVPPRRPSQPSSTSVTSYTNHGITAGEMEQEVENGIPKTKTSAEETQSLVSSSIESLVAEDTIYASLKAELEADGQDFEAESWSLAVDQAYAKKQSKEVIKRQDVIYELMQTEMHHLRTLKIMLHVYNRGMKEELQPSDRHLVGKIFPCLHQLLEIHGVFFSRLKERRKDSLEEGSDRNYLIQKIGDVLSQQFSGEYGEEMKVQYGNFCGQHNEAVNYYKEMYQQNKKFQNLIKKLSNYAVVRRLGVQECILLVTQRITKYPVLVERIIQNTEAGSEDHDELTKALLLIKDTISDVDERVSVCEKARRLKEIANRMEPKSIAKLKNGDAFRKVDMLRSKRRLLYEGVVCWKAASGRLKDILALVLTDVILLLQEKDQKYSFATVDQKPAGISLQKLIVREVANEEKGMFLISASDEGPEMYEIHTNSKEERNTWMAVIRDAINRFPIEEAALNEDQQQDEKKAAQIKELQQRLGGKDEELKRTLSEKLEIFGEIAEIHGYTDAGRPRLLLRADALESQRDSTLNDALKEVENLQNLIAAQPINVSWQLDDSLGSSALPRRAETFGGYDSSSANPSKDGSIKRKSNTLSSSSELKVKEKAGSRASSEPQLQDVCSDGESGRASDLPRWYTISTSSFLHDAEFVQSVQTLTSQLYKLKVLIAQYDSYIEMQRYTGASGERDRQSRLLASRGSLLLEQEKQRNVEKQREEWANVQKLQNQVRQEQQKWERDRERQKRELDIQEARLQDREKSLQQLMERLAQDKEELERHRQEYQQDLERLRESQRTVEKDRERLEQRQRKQLKHNPVLFPTETGQIPGFPHMDGDRMEVNPMLLNEGAMAQQSLKYQGQQSMVVELGERPADSPLQRENSTASMFARTENRSSLIPKTEVPIHLVSATNQILKHTGVQQKIPTKLATLKGGKEKSGKGKDRQSSVSGTASFSTPHGTGSNNPVKFLTKDDGTLRGRRSSSPVISSSQSFSQQESSVPVDIQHEPQQALSTSLTSGSPQPQSAPVVTVTQQPAPQRVQDESGTEIIFF